jgi:hypothetical protein
MHASPDDIGESHGIRGLTIPGRASEAPSLSSVYSNRDEPLPSLPMAAREGSGEEGLDGIRYYHEKAREVVSPALPDSVRTSVASYFDNRRMI